ncbi:hypothetical protein QUH46_25945 [Klebsiella grimontii]|uniref:hypothetical protein n=3 Tax=Klebsiella grimontii TaxID=2058152 RepID=UPI0025A2B96A|nr:hypothetical protein [Klebsiella grimontii]MDM6727726.1 hypothetical protein [Klebsiella grimontii]MDM7224794.1 hypothetical protein [Klebsiella grimontii]MDM7254902.1 hypothetical protein [Klebsiella grimontii]
MTITARLGGRTLLGEGTYIIPSSETLSVSVSLIPEKFPELAEAKTLTLNVEYNDSGEKQTVFFSPDGENSSKMTLCNWNNSLGTTLNTLYPLMNIEGKMVELCLYNVRVGETNVLTLQFWLPVL